MWFAYIDESKDSNKYYVYSALLVNGNVWPYAFDAVKKLRQLLKNERGIPVTHELHGWKFAAGKEQISHRPIYKPERAEIYEQVLAWIANSGFFRLMSSANKNEQYAFERLMNRINKAAGEQLQHVLLFCDEGEQAELTRRIRKLRVYNPIPSRFNKWDTGTATKNIPLEWFVEDPIFKDSRSSYFIQLVDMCAYALLRMERPLPSRSALGYDRMYKLLEPIVVKECNINDPRGLGIIR